MSSRKVPQIPSLFRSPHFHRLAPSLVLCGEYIVVVEKLSFNSLYRPRSKGVVCVVLLCSVVSIVRRLVFLICLVLHRLPFMLCVVLHRLLFILLVVLNRILFTICVVLHGIRVSHGITGFSFCFASFFEFQKHFLNFSISL